MAILTQLRRDLRSQWEDTNPVIHDGEMILVRETENGPYTGYKIGEGVKTFNELEYGNNGSVLQNLGIDGNAAVSQKVTTDHITEYNVSKQFPTGGFSGGNTYTLETAIAKVPTVLQTVGMRVTFISNETSEFVTYLYKGNSWAVENFYPLITQELGDSETEVMSQKAVSDKLYKGEDILNSFSKGNNIVDSKYLLNSQYINPSGILGNSVTQGCIYMFPVKSNQKYIVSRIGQSYRIALYNSNKDFIGFSIAINSGNSFNYWASFKTEDISYVSINYLMPMSDDFAIEEVDDTVIYPSDEVAKYTIKNEAIPKEKEIIDSTLPIESSAVYNFSNLMKTASERLNLALNANKVYNAQGIQSDAAGFTCAKFTYNGETLLYSGCIRGGSNYIAVFLDSTDAVLGTQHVGVTGVNNVIQRELIIPPIDTFYICFNSYDTITPLIIEKADINNFANQDLALQTIPSSEKVFHSLTTFSHNLWIKDFVIDLVLYTNTGEPINDRIGIGSVNRNPGGNTVITICKVADVNSIIDSSNSNQVCYSLIPNWSEPVENKGRKIEKLTFTERDSSGVTGYITVDWEAFPMKETSTVYNTFYGTDTLLSDKIFTSQKIDKPSGHFDTVFQLEDIDCRLITSNGFQTDNTPDWLFILILGNSSNVVNNGAMPTDSALQWFREHRITLASIQIQDSYQEPFTGNTGWGNDETVTRVIKLYNYLQYTYNFHKEVILSGASMGGLTMGQLLYRKPFPIVFGLGVGPVPGIEIIWNNSPARRPIIRNSFGMAADGSDDDELSAFIQGKDWYKMGMLNLSDMKVKVGFPNTYLYYGNDYTFRTEFGGVTQYTEIANALINAGVTTIVKQVGTTDVDGHATPLIYQQAINDGIFSKEIGILQ